MRWQFFCLSVTPAPCVETDKQIINDLLCVEWDVKPYTLNASASSLIELIF